MKDRMTPPRTDRGRLLLVLTLAVAVAVFTATVPLLRDWFDLRVYYGAVNSWIHHGGRIYDYEVPGTTYGFTYPPFAAVSMLPMALVGLHTAVVGSLLLNLAALALVLHILTDGAWRRYGWFGCALGACLLPCSNHSVTPSASVRSTFCCWRSCWPTPGCSAPGGSAQRASA